MSEGSAGPSQMPTVENSLDRFTAILSHIRTLIDRAENISNRLEIRPPVPPATSAASLRPSDEASLSSSIVPALHTLAGSLSAAMRELDDHLTDIGRKIGSRS